MTVGVAEPLYHLNDPPMRTAKPARPNQPFPIRPEGRRSGAMWILGGPSASRADRRPAADFGGFWQRHAIMRGGQHHQTAADLHRSWWPGPGSNRRPSAFQTELRLTRMCFNWSVWAKAGQPDALEYLVHRFGPILAPWILRDATARPSALANGFTVRMAGVRKMSARAVWSADLG